MTMDAESIGLGLFVFAGFATVIKLRKHTVSPKSVTWFLVIIGFLTICRLTLFVYLKFLVPHYSFTLLDSALSILLYPELSISTPLMSILAPRFFPNAATPIYRFPVFWVIHVIIFAFGSFIWALPSLVFLCEKKQNV